MKSSTLHRSNLTKERMSMLENVKFQGKRPSSSNQFIRINKTPELDLLYRSLGKTVSAVTNAASGNRTRPHNPSVYYGIGIFCGAIFLIVVGLIVWASSLPAKKPADIDIPKAKPSLEVVSDVNEFQEEKYQEKYTIKSGDTLDRVAHRFYGKYDVKKIEEIKKINNITNPEGLQVGQVLIIPLDR